ncbi:glycine--tRNA ligase [bacterium]|jgi:glycyl-tRNA synthetase|nr:glycine--tRNA ligase [bacterium]
MSSSQVSLEKIVALCKRRGFVFKSADIYGGLNGFYDFGPLGAILKRNIKDEWTKNMMLAKDSIIFLDGAQLGGRNIWSASGHIENFYDEMVDCLECKHRYRTDEIEIEKSCPHCGNKKWSPPRNFNMMFKTHVGALEKQSSEAYLRPETAQTIFVNFKNILTSSRVKIPFGIAQIGKAFRNEITPKQFLFRMREFEQMEMEWFCKEKDSLKMLDEWVQERVEFYYKIGIKKENLRTREHEPEELAHYSTKSIDVEYLFPFGWKELEGIAYRGNYDLSQHSKHSGKELSIYDDQAKESFIPHVVECSTGVDRLFLTLMCDAYREEKIEGEERVVLGFSPKVAPIKAAFFPLTKKQTEAFLPVYKKIRQKYPEIQFDESGSIGKRYRRQDEIGTPVCFTYDFDSENDNSVTARDRDTTKQTRINLESIDSYLENILK